MWKLIVPLILAACSFAQSTRIYSEFQRVDPFGAIVAADRAEEPREILSPALARNAWTTFQVVVTAPAGETPRIYVGQNPEGAVKIALYKPLFVQHGQAWIPDRLEPLKLPDSGEVPELLFQVPGQTARVFWMDLWVAGNARVRRTRLEVQVYVNDRWEIYPMELRIQEARVPPISPQLAAMADSSAPAADSALGPLRAYLCGKAPAGDSGPLTVRQLIRRNARQDEALARSLDGRAGRAAVVNGLLSALEARDQTAWCAAPASPRGAAGAEWYLGIRNFLYRMGNRPIDPVVSISPPQ